MLRLYDQLSSGNGYKARLVLHLLGRSFERIEVDIFNGASRTPEFLRRNPVGKIPVLELEDSTCLWESDAILFYLAEDTPFWPGDRLERAKVLQWMFFEQYCPEPTVAVVRSWVKYDRMPKGAENELAEKRADGYAVLQVMEDRLSDHAYLVGDRCSIADLAFYAYTHVAPEGGFDLSPYPAIGVWMDRIRSLPGYVPITQA